VKVVLFILALAATVFAQDISIDTVLGWEDTMPIHPRVVISNHPSGPVEGLDFYFTIDDGTPNGYTDSIKGLYFYRLTTETLDLGGGWVPHGKESLGLLVYLHWPPDTNPANDTWTRKIRPRALDVAVTGIVSPRDTIDSGTVIWPSSDVMNVGTITARFELRHVTEGYRCVDSVVLLPSEGRIVTASQPLVALPGVRVMTAYAELTGDLNPTDNLATDTFWVRPLPGVEETPSAEVRTTNAGPTILSGAMVQSLESRVVFDAMGRRVRGPKPGVLFIEERSAVGGQRSAFRVRKVILQR
jgi:hypothetical protein